MKSSNKSNDKSGPHNNRRKSPPKTNSVNMNPKDQVKEMFIKWFKKNNTLGQTMSKQDVVRNILTKLDSKQDDALNEAMEELVRKGLIEVQADGVTLSWTQKGVDLVEK
ncbi:hypothetical protein N9A28_04960 [Sulfurimonas sp.]|nr:hypothetical protein [Sulfurimonas sp.]